MAVKVGGRERLTAVIDLNVEVFPEQAGARCEIRQRTGARAQGRRDERAIGRGQPDFDDDLDNLLLTKMIEPSLLGAVVADVVAGELSELGERSEKSNGRNVGATFGRGGNLT